MILKHAADKGIDLNGRQHFGTTPFMVACEENWIEVVQELLQHPGVDYNARDKLGRTAFLKACAKGHRQIVSHLVRHKGEKSTSLQLTMTESMHCK